MPRDLPDWGALSAQTTVHEITDLGELAARLDSIVTFDRRGDVVWLDGFECGLAKWATTPTGKDAAVTESTARARNGATSALLTAGSDGGRSAQIEHPYAIPSISNLGVEFSFARSASIERLQLTWDILTGLRLLEPSIWYDDLNSQLLYKDSAGDPQVLDTDVYFTADYYRFNTIKLVVNLIAEEYVRLIVNTREYDMRGIAMQASSTTTAANAQVFILNKGNAGVNNKVYIDDVILTQNEPP